LAGLKLLQLRSLAAHEIASHEIAAELLITNVDGFSLVA
jgi:hypothetical protein